jgi:hypothetical protein
MIGLFCLSDLIDVTLNLRANHTIKPLHYLLPAKKSDTNFSIFIKSYSSMNFATERNEVCERQ